MFFYNHDDPYHTIQILTIIFKYTFQKLKNAQSIFIELNNARMHLRDSINDDGFHQECPFVLVLIGRGRWRISRNRGYGAAGVAGRVYVEDAAAFAVLKFATVFQQWLLVYVVHSAEVGDL